jgi:CRP-like cAMP-binding protein
MTGLNLIVRSNLVLLPHLGMQQQSFKRRELLRVESGFWQITRGYIRALSLDEEGTQITLGLWQPGDIIGKYFSQVVPYHLECLTSGEAMLLPPAYRPEPNILLDHLYQTQELLTIAQVKRLELRLEKFLDWLVFRFGTPTDRGYQIEVRLTHQEISEAIGSTRVSVTRVLKQFQHTGKIRWSSHHLIVLK